MTLCSNIWDSTVLQMVYFIINLDAYMSNLTGLFYFNTKRCTFFLARQIILMVFFHVLREKSFRWYRSNNTKLETVAVKDQQSENLTSWDHGATLRSRFCDPCWGPPWWERSACRRSCHAWCWVCSAGCCNAVTNTTHSCQPLHPLYHPLTLLYLLHSTHATLRSLVLEQCAS